MSMRLLGKTFEQVVCQFEKGDIPPVPKTLLFFYIKLEQRFVFDRMGMINLDDFFVDTSMKNKDRFEFMRLMKHFGLIEYENLGDRNFKVKLVPQSKCFMSGAINQYPAYDLRDMLETIDRLKTTKEENNDN